MPACKFEFPLLRQPFGIENPAPPLIGPAAYSDPNITFHGKVPSPSSPLRGRRDEQPLAYSTVMETGDDGMPFAITTSELVPVSMFAGTSKLVETVVLPVATPMVLGSCSCA